MNISSLVTEGNTVIFKKSTHPRGSFIIITIKGNNKTIERIEDMDTFQHHGDEILKDMAIEFYSYGCKPQGIR